MDKPNIVRDLEETTPGTVFIIFSIGMVICISISSTDILGNLVTILTSVSPISGYASNSNRFQDQIPAIQNSIDINNNRYLLFKIKRIVVLAVDLDTNGKTF